VRKALCVAVLAVGLVACTAEQRRNIATDVDTYNHGGVPSATAPDIGIVAVDTAIRAAEKGAEGGPGAAIAYIVGGVVAVAAGIVGRKYLKKGADAVQK
jgi:hypothetical protein